MSAISLNKLISDSGYCSRREADVLIAEGRVTVNDMLGKIGMRIMPEDIVAVDFEILKNHHQEQMVILAYHKPKGLTCTTDLLDKTSVMHFINYQKRVFPVGRLDKDSEGLLLFTNNGDIVNKILRSGNNHDKEYWVTLAKPYDKEFIKKMSTGVNIDAGLTKPAKVIAISPRKFSITLTQGLNRQIRKMCKALNAKVEMLQRVRIMNVYIGKMAPGKFRVLNTAEVNGLMELIKDSKNTADAKQRREYIPTRRKPNGEFVPKGAQISNGSSFGKDKKDGVFNKIGANTNSKLQESSAVKKERYQPKPAGRQAARETSVDNKRYVPKSEVGKISKLIPKANTKLKPKDGIKKNVAASKKKSESKVNATPLKKGSYKAFKENKKK
jgi:23S rRNA pseudouridine2604 synthase